MVVPFAKVSNFLTSLPPEISNVTTNTFDINIGSSPYVGSHTFVSATTNGLERQDGTFTINVGDGGSASGSIHTFVSSSNEAVKQAVIAGLGWSIMPIIGIRNEVESGLLKIIPMKGLPIQTTWQLIWLKEKKLSPIAESYLAYLAKEKDNIIQNYFALPSQK